MRSVEVTEPAMLRLGHPDLNWSADQLRTYAELLATAADVMDRLQPKREVWAQP